MRMTLREILNTCGDWDTFCRKYGWSEWAVSEGGGHIEQELTLEEAYELGILRKSP